MTAQPMASVRMGDGCYEVLGTSTACEVKRTGLGWMLTSNGSLVDVFTTKRAALIYCQNHPEL